MVGHRHRARTGLGIATAIVGWASTAWADPPPIRGTGLETTTIAEFHYMPVDGTQIAVWLEDDRGEFLRDVFVTQATAKLGIGNRSGIWNFLSSWRAPYGPRRSVLPVWAHRRGRVYPEIVFHDPVESHATSLGFHEATSSAEPYHCRPLTPTEHGEILDSMTCPSPQTFQTDKGRFDPDGGTSVYPPRGDIATFEPGSDHDDIKLYGGLNDLDAVSGATPVGFVPTFVAVQLTDAERQMPFVSAFIEVSLEADENADWSFDRDNDHFVDSLLSAYGIEWLGQPSAVYEVRFDPGRRGVTATSDYAGYGDWDGATGALHPPDGTISTDNGSGADRLQEMSAFGETFRFGVNTGKGGTCAQAGLVPVERLTVSPMDFDSVRLSFTVPDLPDVSALARFVIRQQQAVPGEDARESAANFDPTTALDVSSFAPAICTGPGQADCENFAAGDEVEIDIPQLFGNYTYSFAVGYQDRCANESPRQVIVATTPAQQFAQIDTKCFVATAAYGAHWEQHVASLRRFRDAYMKPNPIGQIVVAAYYAYGPTLAGPLRRSHAGRATVRALLAPVAAAAAAMTQDPRETTE